ncbi:haloacid dehalogenase family protein, subfamily IB, phosphoserine phosphatase [alpha proteobacterium HIMB114]|nr:haloacid dehalogenase family protein, subfamily IB, phosphoserine phosphatase [alpha proteobacterium HIMB114]
MNNKFLSLVANEKFVADELINFCKENFSFKILSTRTLSNHALEVEIENFDINKTQDLNKIFNQKQIDFCIRDKNFKDFKVLLCDMDATMIANETLDDLVKITGSDYNVDETSKLAMEGKIDLRTTLKNRVEILKGQPKSLINEVLKGIKFNPGGKTLVSTLNNLGFESNLITGGFKPISTYVGKELGFKNVISNEFNFDENNCFTGDYVPITGQKNSKYMYMEKINKEKNIPFAEMVSVGDGSNDLEMLKHSGLGIGYHAHQIIKNNILNQINFTNLETVLYFLGIKEENFII